MAGDSSGNGNTGTLTPTTGGPTWTSGTDAKVGSGALQFDGVNDYVRSSIGIPASKIFSIAFWTKLGPIREGQVFSWNYWVRALYAYSNLYFDVTGDAISNGIPTTCLNDNKWHHIAAINNNISQTLYCDGNLVGSSSQTPYATTGTLFLASEIGTGHFWNGSIDDVRIYNRVLSVSEISQLYDLGTGNSSPGTYILSITNNGTGSGVVSSNPAGINCGLTCSASFNSGPSVVLTATANPGSIFAGWSGGGCSGTGTCAVILNEAVSVTATFNTQQSSDIQTPTAPTNLSATAVSPSQIDLVWTTSTDNTGVTGYRIYRNGTQVGTSVVANYSDTGLTANTPYLYTVLAYDAANNASVQTGAVSATTPQQTVTPTLGNIYITQNGTGSGISCTDSHSVTWFNTAGSWGTGVGQIGLGTTVHLCGTISTSLVVQASGSSGSPITIVFETGAKLSSAYWGVGSSAAISANAKSYITVDGNNTGVIENTANGDGLANEQVSSGIYITSCSFIEIKNLTIQNIYIHVQNSNYPSGSVETYGIADDGCSNVSIHNNTIHDVKYGLFRIASNSGSTLNWYSNTIYDVNWGMGVTAAGSGVVLDTVNIYNNDITMGNKWDDIGNSNHHNGIYAYTDVPEAGQITNLSIYGNYFHGAVGQVWTSTANIFTSYAVPNLKIYNNLFVGNSGDPANGYITLAFETGASTPLIANNTIIGSSATSYNNAYGTISPRCIILDVNTNTNATITNNICSTVAHGILTTSGSSFTSDYNDFYNVGYYGVVNGTYYSAWSGGSSWQAAGHDANGINTNPLLSGTYTIPSNSPNKDTGTSLSGLFTTDKAGTSRPQGSAWDIGV